MPQTAIIVISSHVVRGTVGNRAAAFALEVLGFPVWCVPTITLPWHPGQGPGTRIVPPADAFSGLLDNLAESENLGEVGAVLTGYLGSADQVEPVARLVEAVKTKNPDAVYALDPVIGDEGKLYVPVEQANLLKKRLLPLADMVTPNCFELEWISGKKNLTNPQSVFTAAKTLDTKNIVVTSTPAGDQIGNMLVTRDGALLAKHNVSNGPPNGLGDLLAALMLGRIMDNHAPREALKLSTASVVEVLEAALAVGSDELTLERNVGSLLAPTRDINISEITGE